MTTSEPIVLAIELALSPVRAYAAFAERFGEWWPAASHSLSRDSATSCRLDARLGGAVLERTPDGTLHTWGEVLEVEPGRRIRFSWYPGRERESAQWIDVDFAPAAGGSRVTLTHGGWEVLGEIGPLLRQEYLSGWRHVFVNLFAEFARLNR